MKFYYHLLYAANSLHLDLFWLHYGDCYSADDYLHCVFGPRYADVNAIYSAVWTTTKKTTTTEVPVNSEFFDCLCLPFSTVVAINS